MAVLVIAEHDNSDLKRATRQAVSAAGRLGGDVHLLVLGSGVDAVAQAAAKVAGVSQVKVVDDPSLAHQLAEAVAAQVVAQAAGYSHVVAAATAHGRDFMPRVENRQIYIMPIGSLDEKTTTGNWRHYVA